MFSEARVASMAREKKSRERARQPTILHLISVDLMSVVRCEKNETLGLWRVLEQKVL
jgi:hypothetical protein